MTEPVATVTPAPPGWRRALPWVFVVLTVVYLAYNTDVAAVVRSLQGVSLWRYTVFISLVALGTLVTDAFATWQAYRPLTPALTYGSLLVVRAASYLPAIINYHVGQAYLTYLLSRIYGAKLTTVAGRTLVVYATLLGNLVALAALSSPFATGLAGWMTRAVVTLTACGAAYLVVLALRPRVLACNALFAPLFEAGVSEHLRLMAWRIPHVAMLFGSLWFAYRFFDIVIPVGTSLTLIPFVLLVSALPITPQGVGTREIVAIPLLSPFVVGDGEPSARVVAAGTAWVVAATIAQALIGILFTRRAARIFATSAEAPLADAV